MNSEAENIFNEKLKLIKIKSCGFLFDKFDYLRIINELKSAKKAEKKSKADYNRLRRFDIITCNYCLI